jgi:hypothetical protein
MIQFPNVQTKIPTIKSNPELGFLPPSSTPAVSQQAVFNPNAPIFNIAQSVDREENRLPKNLKEAYEFLDMITGEKSSKNRKVFDLPELKQIAKSLDISPTGNKTEIARRIRQAVEKYHSIQ